MTFVFYDCSVFLVIIFWMSVCVQTGQGSNQWLRECHFIAFCCFCAIYHIISKVCVPQWLFLSLFSGGIIIRAQMTHCDSRLLHKCHFITFSCFFGVHHVFTNILSCNGFYLANVLELVLVCRKFSLIIIG